MVHNSVMTRQVNVAEAKAKLSELVEAASRGEEIVLARYGKPMAKLSAIGAVTPVRRRLGALKDRLSAEDVRALVRAIELHLSKKDAAALSGDRSDETGLSRRKGAAQRRR